MNQSSDMRQLSGGDTSSQARRGQLAQPTDFTRYISKSGGIGRSSRFRRKHAIINCWANETPIYLTEMAYVCTLSQIDRPGVFRHRWGRFIKRMTC